MTRTQRKQREWQQREQLILDTAQHILNAEGYASLTMERVALEIEYSKGTIYNHFSSKEEIISSISCRCLNRLGELFSRAVHYQSHTRARISAIVIAHSLYALLHPTEIQNMQITKSRAIRDRISEDRQADILALEQQVTGIAMDIVAEAISIGDIPEHHRHDIDSIVFGLWTMGYGSNLLHLSGIPFAKLGMRNPLDIVWTNSNKLLDSYQWAPTSETLDLEALYQTISNDLYKEEIQQIHT
jgi:AcrR family transcriptional regulator